MIPSEIPSSIQDHSLSNAFKTLHGRVESIEEEEIEIAKNQLILEEFLRSKSKLKKENILKNQSSITLPSKVHQKYLVQWSHYFHLI